MVAIMTPDGECGQSPVTSQPLITSQSLNTRQEIGARKAPCIRQGFGASQGPGARQILANRQAFDTKQIRVQCTVRPILVSHIDPVILWLDAFKSSKIYTGGIYTSKMPVVLSVETNNSPITISFRTISHDGNIHNEKADYLPTFYAIVPSGSPPPGINDPRRRWISGKRLNYYNEEVKYRKYGWDIYAKVYRKEYKVNTYMPRCKQPESGKRKYSDRVVVTAKDNNKINSNIMDFVICIEVTK